MKKLFSGFAVGLVSAAVLFTSHLAYAANGVPTCYNKNIPLDLNNDQVVVWRAKTYNQFQARAYVSGVVTRVFPDRNGHDHFEIKIGQGSRDLLEVVFNQHFGRLPEIEKGMKVAACGDYITSNAPNKKYPASPSGALIHWVHKNKNGKGHEDGFVVIGGQVFGF